MPAEAPVKDGRAAAIALNKPRYWKITGPPAINATSGGSSSCKKISFLAIQKTGTSTMYMDILPEVTKRQSQLFTLGHLNWNMALDRTPPQCTFTMLRDPVDRFLSEFAMARSMNGFELFTQDWDFNQDDLPWLYKVEHLPNVTQAMLEYLHNPNNPTRNRQMLYLLGFDHIKACRRLFYRNMTIQRCPQGEAQYPAHVYNWDWKPEELLAIAKERLMSLRAFGLTDCYVDSIRHVGTAMGWDPNLTVTLGTLHRERFAEVDKRWIYIGDQQPLARMGFAQTVIADRLKEGYQRVHTMAHFISPELEAEIRRVNSLDVELVEFARQQLVARGVSSCAREAPPAALPPELS